MTWFEAFRNSFGFTYYGEQRTPVTVDVQFVIVIYTCILISIATIIAAAGIRGKERWYTLLRVTYGLSVGTTILLCIYGFCWQTGNMDIHSPYIFRSHDEIDGKMAIHIGLQKLNITLSGVFEGSKSEVKYNEEISLRQEPGHTAELNHCLKRGMPLPILNVVEFLTVDAGYLRWGRSYTMAGYFAYILLWTSFSFWMLANIMMCSVVFYGAFMFTLTGITMILSVVCYHVLQPQFTMRLIGTETEFQIKYGICFWVILVIGILTVVLGLVILFLDYKVPKTAAKYILLETQFVKEEVYGSEIRRSTLMNNYQQISFSRRQSAPVLGNINKGFDVNEVPFKNPLYKDNESNETRRGHLAIHRSATSPGNITDTPPHFLRGSTQSSMRSLGSINENVKEESSSMMYGLSPKSVNDNGKKSDDGQSRDVDHVINMYPITESQGNVDSKTSDTVIRAPEEEVSVDIENAQVKDKIDRSHDDVEIPLEFSAT